MIKSIILYLLLFLIQIFITKCGKSIAYDKEKKIAICIPPKSGSTSFWNWYYSTKFNKKWKYKDFPWIQDVTSVRWNDTMRYLTSKQEWSYFHQEKNNKLVYSIAIIRDPKERLISSWKSKLACDVKKYKTDINDRARMIASLLELLPDWNQYTINGGKKIIPNCLKISQFLDVMLKITKSVTTLGQISQINSHFRSQRSLCFTKADPSMWNQVTLISNNTAIKELSHHLGVDINQHPLEHVHKTTKVRINLTPEDERKLDLITATDYKFLNKFLSSSKSSNNNKDKKNNHEKKEAFLTID